MKVILDVSEFQSPAQLDNLLHTAPDEIVGVYIKATQDVNYRDSLCDAFAAVCEKHNTPYGYYDFLTNAQIIDQEKTFAEFVNSLKHKPSLKPMTDCEGAYNKFAAGVTNWEVDFGGQCVTYAQLSNMPQYASMNNPKWVAQYDSMSYYRPRQSEIDAYKREGYVLWQWTSNYLGHNQDASVLLDDDISRLKA